jgi:ribosome-associated protein
VIPAQAMTWRFSRGTGPGGQGVNTMDSRVELVVDLTAMVAPDAVAGRVREALGDSLRIVVTTERSQLRNRELALQRLIRRVDAAARPRRSRTPTRRPRARCGDASMRNGCARSSRRSDAIPATKHHRRLWPSRASDDAG